MNDDRLAREDVGHVFVFPERGLAACHVADAADAVDDRLVVPVARVHLQQFGMLGARRHIADLPAVVDADRIGRVEPDDAPVLDIHARHPIAGRRHDERVVEADARSGRRDLAVPVRATRRAQTEMPLADDAGRVAGTFQHRGQGRRAAGR